MPSRGRVSARLMLQLLASLPVVARATETLAGVCGGDCRPQKFATCGGFLEGATVDAAGGLWVLDLLGDRILSITDSGKCVTHGKTGGKPNGAKFSKDGRLIIADSERGLLAFDPVTSKVTVLADQYNGQSLATANDLAIDEAGGIYFTVVSGSNLLNPVGRVFYLPAGRKELTLVTDKLAFPNGIAIGAGGQTILVAEFAAKRVVSLPSVTAKGGRPLIHLYAITRGGVGPDGILIDSKGRLLTANMGTGEVLAFSADGRPLGAIELPDEAGKLITNFTVRGDSLFITEASKGELWRVPYAN
jgi:gluconolactonase